MREILERLSHLPGFEQREYDGQTKFSDLSDRAVRDLYDAVRRALEDDDSKNDPAKRRFRVRETADWREWADDLEAELVIRGVKFTQIKW